LVSAARVEVVLERHRHTAVVVAAAVRHDQKNGVIAVLRVGPHRVVNLANAVVDNGDGPRVEMAVAQWT